jgi:hypothetical protein
MHGAPVPFRGSGIKAGSLGGPELSDRRTAEPRCAVAACALSVRVAAPPTPRLPARCVCSVLACPRIPPLEEGLKMIHCCRGGQVKSCTITPFHRLCMPLFGGVPPRLTRFLGTRLSRDPSWELQQAIKTSISLGRFDSHEPERWMSGTTTRTLSSSRWVGAPARRAAPPRPAATHRYPAGASAPPRPR